MRSNVNIAFNLTATSSYPTTGDIEEILNLGRRYPSGDNCQPFTILQTSLNEFEIKYQYERGKHFLNTNNIPSVITLGFLIESLSLAASQKNCRIEYQKDIDYQTDKSAWLKFRILKSESAKDFLSDYLLLRHTNRGLYAQNITEIEKIILNSSLKASMNSSVVSFKIERISSKMTSYILTCEEVFWKKRDIIADLGKWISLKLFTTPKEGFYWKTLSLNYLETIGLKLLSKAPVISEKLSYFLNLLNKRKLKKQLIHSGGVIFFKVPKIQDHDYLEIGRSIFRSWLQLTALDFEIQPLSISTLLPYFINTFKDSKEINSALVNKIKTMGCALKEDMGISDSEEILWGLRFGRKLENDQITLSKRNEALYLEKKPHNK
jgi:hypothetical protein